MSKPYELEVVAMRVCACRLLDLKGVWVRSVVFDADRVVVAVALRRRRLVCAHCAFSTRHRENEQLRESVWRHLDLGVWRLEIRATLRRLRCPEHGVHVEGVPFARHGARCTRDFDDLVVRHEAPWNRAGCRSPPPGCRSSPVKRGAA